MRFTCGIAKRSVRLEMMRAGMMARVRGILILRVVPLPKRLDTPTVPPIFSMFVLTTSIPTPRPETFVTLSAVEKPGSKMRLQISLSVSCAPS